MECIEKLIKEKDQNPSGEFMIPDTNSKIWKATLNHKKNNLIKKLQKYFNDKSINKQNNPHTIKILSPKKCKLKRDITKSPKNFSSKKKMNRISKSNNLKKKHLNEIENELNISIIHSKKKRGLNSSQKKSEKKEKRQKSEIPVSQMRTLKIQREFTLKYKNSIPFPEQMYSLLSVLGKGSYGQVFLAVHILSGQQVAIKAIKKERNDDTVRNYQKIINEIEIFSQMSHRNIINLYEIFENAKYIFLVTEFAEKGDLLSLLQKNGPFSESQIYIVIKDILNALNFIHSRNILHRDIKLDNILLDRNNNLKICDFGISLKMKSNQYYTDRCGTPAYIAPEIIKSKYKEFKSDYWSLGVTLFILITATPPFKAKSFNSIKGLILKKGVKFPENLEDISENLKTIIL